MAEDASLDDFLDVEGESDDPDEDAVAPAAPTYRWDPEGGVCERCGETARLRWRDDGAFVCPDCKEW